MFQPPHIGTVHPGMVGQRTFSDLEIHGSGDWAWATSGSVLIAEGAEGPIPRKQLVVLRRQSDGTWLTAAVHVSSDLPPPGNGAGTVG